MIEPPWIEDDRHCREGQHLWIINNGGNHVYCYNCGINFKDKDKK